MAGAARQPAAANIEERILTPTSFLYYEPQFLLQTELRDPRNYMAILQAIATGHNRLADICRAAGIDRGQASRSLATLRELHLVERRVPATERQPEKSRRGRYVLRDNFLRFWFRFVLPHQELLDLGRIERARKTIEEQLPAFVARAFEDLGREWVLVQGDEGRLPFYPERAGAWWEHGRLAANGGQREADSGLVGRGNRHRLKALVGIGFQGRNHNNVYPTF